MNLILDDRYNFPLPSPGFKSINLSNADFQIY